MSEIFEVYTLIKELISNNKIKKKDEFDEYVERIFCLTETVTRNYMNMFSEIRINIISEKFSLLDVINYMTDREYELKDMRVLIRSFLDDKYYKSNNTLVKFVAGIYGIMECHPVCNRVIVDKSKHTISSYIKYCEKLVLETDEVQKIKILAMTEYILKDITVSWKTVCDCYRLLKFNEI